MKTKTDKKSSKVKCNSKGNQFGGTVKKKGGTTKK